MCPESELADARKQIVPTGDTLSPAGSHVLVVWLRKQETPTHVSQQFRLIGAIFNCRVRTESHCYLGFVAHRGVNHALDRQTLAIQPLAGAGTQVARTSSYANHRPTPANKAMQSLRGPRHRRRCVVGCGIIENPAEKATTGSLVER